MGWGDAHHVRTAGLSQEAFAALVGSEPPVSHIIHAAALVNHVLPYDALRGANVIGTQEVLRFAVQQARRWPRGCVHLHFVSTIGVVTPDSGRNLMGCVSREAFAHLAARAVARGYGQTKRVRAVLRHVACERRVSEWCVLAQVSEHLLASAASACPRRLRCSLSRPAFIAAHSVTGFCNLQVCLEPL